MALEKVSTHPQTERGSLFEAVLSFPADEIEFLLSGTGLVP
jgi:hypothetical protein